MSKVKNSGAREVGFSDDKALSAYVEVDQRLIDMATSNLAAGHGHQAFAHELLADQQWLESQTALMTRALDRDAI